MPSENGRNKTKKVVKCMLDGILFIPQLGKLPTETIKISTGNVQLRKIRGVPGISLISVFGGQARQGCKKKQVVETTRESHEKTSRDSPYKTGEAIPRKKLSPGGNSLTK